MSLAQQETTSNPPVTEPVAAPTDEQIKFMDKYGEQLKTQKGRDEAFIYAIVHGDNENAKLLKSAGADVNARDDAGQTPLMKAVQAQNLDMVEYLIDSGADASVKDKSGNTALMYAREKAHMKPDDAVTQDDRQALSEYLQPGSGRDLTKVQELPPVTNETSSNLSEHIRDMVDNGFGKAEGTSDPTNVNKDYQASVAKNAGDKSRAIVVLVQDATLPDQVSRAAEVKHDALYDAVMKGDKDKVAELLKNGADAKKLYTQDTLEGRVNVGLLEVAAQRHSTNGSKMQPLSEKMSENGLEIARMLIEHGADVNAADQRGTTALMEAAKNGDISMIHLLAKAKGSNINAQDTMGFTALHYAADAGHTQAMQALREEGADPNIRDGTNKTPLERMRLPDRADNAIVALPAPQKQRERFAAMLG